MKTLDQILNHQPQCSGDEHGREPSLYAVLVHYYMAHGAAGRMGGEAEDFAQEYVAELRKFAGVA